jgi:hypothetical protein
MARARLLAALAALLLCLLPAAAHARSQPLHVGVSSADGSGPVVGVKVDIRDMQGNLLGSGVTNSSGNASVTIELPDGVDKVLIDIDAGKAQGRSTFAVVDVRHASPTGMGIAMHTGIHSAAGAEFIELARGAIAHCDKAAYDRWVGELNSRLADLEKELDKAQQAADAYARANNLRITDLAGARKDRQRAAKAQEKLDPAVRNSDVLDALDDYIDRLQDVDAARRDLDEARSARDAMPPFPADCKKDKVGYLPGSKACPDGSGGLLAGALNDIFDSDLDPACDEDRPHRDTDRSKKDREHRRD